MTILSENHLASRRPSLETGSEIVTKTWLVSTIPSPSDPSASTMCGDRRGGGATFGWERRAAFSLQFMFPPGGSFWEQKRASTKRIQPPNDRFAQNTEAGNRQAAHDL